MFCALQRPHDAYALVNVNLKLLFGNPAVLVLQYLQRRLGVAAPRGLVQNVGHLALAIGAAFELGHLRNWVHLAQPPVFRRHHAGGERQRIPAQAKLSGFVDLFQARLGGL